MKKYTLIDNAISVVIGLLIAVTVAVGAYKSQSVGATTIEPTPTLPYIEEPTELETLLSCVEPTTEAIEETEAITEPVIEFVNIGEYRITAYCKCEACCSSWANNRPDGIVYGASGNVLIPNYSIAVDPDVIPYGTVVYIDGLPYVAHDCGGSIKDKSIDLYMASHEEALNWGVQYKDVYIFN